MDEISEENVLSIIDTAVSVTACGNKVVEFLVSKGIVKDETVKCVGGVKHVMIFRV